MVSLPPCRLYGVVVQRAPPLGAGRVLILSCGWNNAGAIDWVDLNRNDHEYWELGMRKVMRGVDSQRRRQQEQEPQ